MKKLLVLVGLVVFTSILCVSIAKLAGAASPLGILKLIDTSSVKIEGKYLDKDVTRFIDGKVVCYVVTTKINGIEANNSISCVK